MAIIWNPQSELLREPDLLEPGKQFVGSVKADLSHPLCPDVVILPYQGVLLNLINNKIAALGVGTANSIDVVNGKRVYAQGTLADSGFFTVPAPGTGKFTWIWRGKTAPTVEPLSRILSSAGGEFTPGYLYFRNHEDPAKPWGMYDDGYALADTVLSGGTWYDLAIVRTGTSNNETLFYIDGKADGAGTSASNLTNTQLKFNDIEARFYTEFYYQYLRVLTDSERQSIYHDPYQFLIPA